MQGLESEASPLRSHQNFYRPFYKLRDESHRKNFLSSSKQNPISGTL